MATTYSNIQILCGMTIKIIQEQIGSDITSGPVIIRTLMVLECHNCNREFITEEARDRHMSNANHY